MRYPLHLPVVVRMARKEMRARSENISLGGILLASDVLIPEGTAVEVVVGVQHLPDPGVLLSALGTVLRVQRKEAGDFGVAIRLQRSFELPFTRPAGHNVGAAQTTLVLDCEKMERDRRERKKMSREKSHREKNHVLSRAPHVASWHMET
jgi:hypothetical protein